MRTAAVLLLACSLAAFAPADPPTPAPTADPPKADAKPAAQWADDPAGRLVFHAVLEGLYEDGVQDAAVDGVVPKNPKAGVDPVKHTFVTGCGLCLPVYEAFAAYQRRPTFAGSKRATLGKGLDAKEADALASDDVRTRHGALAVCVQRWVERRMTAMRLTPAERADWDAKLAERAKDGKNLLLSLMKDDSAYRGHGWSWYTGCAACNGVSKATTRK